MQTSNDDGNVSYTSYPFTLSLTKNADFESVPDDLRANRRINRAITDLKIIVSVIQGLRKPKLDVKFDIEDLNKGLQWFYSIMIVENQEEDFKYLELIEYLFECFKKTIEKEKSEKIFDKNYLYLALTNNLKSYNLREFYQNEKEKLRLHTKSFMDHINDYDQMYSIKIESRYIKPKVKLINSDQEELRFSGEVQDLDEPTDLIDVNQDNKNNELGPLPNESNIGGEYPSLKSGNTLSSIKKRKKTIISTNAIIESLTLDNSFPSRVRVHRRQERWYFTEFSHKYIIQNIEKSISKKQEFIVVEKPAVGSWTYKLKIEDKLKDEGKLEA